MSQFLKNLLKNSRSREEYEKKKADYERETGEKMKEILLPKHLSKKLKLI